jgi:hypothetical protein
MRRNALPGRPTCSKLRPASTRCPSIGHQRVPSARSPHRYRDRAGRPPRAYDALIASTAMARGLPVYTCNAADFEGIDGLRVVPVTLPQQAPS